MSTLKTNKLVHTANGASEFTLPQTDGSPGQVLKTDGSGNLSWVSPSPSLFSSYAIICDEKPSGTNGGDFNSGSWETRDLNTEVADPDGIVSISSNQFTLQAGTYLIKAKAPAWRVNLHQIRLQNITDSTTVEYGTTGQAYGSGNFGFNHTFSFVDTRLTISAAKAFEIQHRCSVSASSAGFGGSSGFGNVSKFAVVEIYKES